jgi:ParB-like chromosome segregation protein Spo0J
MTSASIPLAFETWPIDRLIEYARNPRKNDHAVDRVAAAIREFGFRVPIVAKSDGLVVDGHLRLKAAKKLGLAEVPVILADDMTDAQIKAFRLSVNKVAELAEWDDELLRLEFDDLSEMGFDLDVIGFDADEIALLQNGPASEIDAPEDFKEADESDLTHTCPKCGFEFDD